MSAILEARDLRRNYEQKRGFFSAPGGSLGTLGVPNTTARSNLDIRLGSVDYGDGYQQAGRLYLQFDN